MGRAPTVLLVFFGASFFLSPSSYYLLLLVPLSRQAPDLDWTVIGRIDWMVNEHSWGEWAARGCARPKEQEHIERLISEKAAAVTDAFLLTIRPPMYLNTVLPPNDALISNLPPPPTPGRRPPNSRRSPRR